MKKNDANKRKQYIDIQYSQTTKHWLTELKSKIQQKKCNKIKNKMTSDEYKKEEKE